MARMDMTSQVFGRLTVIAVSTEKVKQNKIFWECLCECGNVVVIDGSHLRTGNTKSCGCFKIDRLKAAKTVHGMCNTPTYSSWEHMRCRCNNPNSNYFADYGGRGITVCERWLKFENFYKDMGDRPSQGHTLGRIDNNGPYSPENCRWETVSQQQSNRRNTRFLTYNGKTQTLTEWSLEIGIPYGTLRSRIDQYGWSVEESLTTPLMRIRRAGPGSANTGKQGFANQ